MQNRFGAPGDFAQAYVIAHEVGHHVQNLMGTMREFDQAAGRVDERQRNALSVRLELQADCYAGVWGFYAAKRNLLEPGDAEEGLRAASAVGDDAIQKRTQGYVVPDAFTHGKAEQRMNWFQTGLQSGDPRACNTFAAKATVAQSDAMAGITCPGCRNPMQALDLERRAAGTLVVDLCALCQALWFDPMESPQLSPRRRWNSFARSTPRGPRRAAHCRGHAVPAVRYAAGARRRTCSTPPGSPTIAACAATAA